jgi:phospholipase C
MESKKMFLRAVAVGLVVVPGAVIFLAGYGSPGGSQAMSPVTKDITVIQHTVFILKENHTFDNYFGTFPGADGATSGTISTGQPVALSHMADTSVGGLCNSWECAVQGMDGGKMDQFDLIYGGALTAYTQLSAQDIPNYRTYAHQFVLGDHFFASVHGPSLPNDFYTIAAQSAGMISNISDSGSGPPVCGGDTTANVQVIDNSGNITNQFPCLDFQRLADRIQSAGLT